MLRLCSPGLLWEGLQSWQLSPEQQEQAHPAQHSAVGQPGKAVAYSQALPACSCAGVVPPRCFPGACRYSPCSVDVVLPPGTADAADAKSPAASG